MGHLFVHGARVPSIAFVMRWLFLLLGVAPCMANNNFVTIASSANITKCLEAKNLAVTLTDCVTHIGAEWNWTIETASKGGHLRLAGVTLDLAPWGDDMCLHRDLHFGRCDATAPIWRWNPATLQMQVQDDHNKTWCLGVNGHELLMETCHVLNGTTSDDQNGIGAPAEQSWVLFPTRRPQISILDDIQFPLRSLGRHIVDSIGKRIKLAGVNWIGAHMQHLVNNGLDVAPLPRIVKTIKYMGFNSVRLGYATAMLEGRRSVPDASLLQANPELYNLSALEVFDKTVQAITDEGLLVIITRHMHEPGWCCHGADGSEMWYGDNYTTEDWMDGLTFMAKRYRNNPRVIGLDIFNEPRIRESDGVAAWWGIPIFLAKAVGLKFEDWRVAATQGAVAVWRGNPDALVIVEGQLYASNLAHVLDRPMLLASQCLQSRVVYSSHEYFWHWRIDKLFEHFADTFRPFSFYEELKTTLKDAYVAGDEDEFGTQASLDAVGRQVHTDFSTVGDEGGILYDDWVKARKRAVFYLQAENKAPVWVSEFGTSRRTDNAWWEFILRYFRESDANWCYWPVDAVAIPRNFNGSVNSFKKETYGVFDTSRGDYSSVVGWKLQDLVGIMAPSEDMPEMLHTPAECTFELESNLAASQEVTSVSEFLGTMDWNAQGTLKAVGLAVLLVLAPIGLCAWLCCYCLARKGNADDSQVGSRYLKLQNPDASKTQDQQVTEDIEDATFDNNSWYCCSSKKQLKPALQPGEMQAPPVVSGRRVR
mmetsp:Transcript_98380/g.195041  ORF Transcript_98380/g.195041 Transcript_98380/m.195041 type:complete len:762 (+) Transcript_98380:19-2304(+)